MFRDKQGKSSVLLLLIVAMLACGASIYFGRHEIWKTWRASDLRERVEVWQKRRLFDKRMEEASELGKAAWAAREKPNREGATRLLQPREINSVFGCGSNGEFYTIIYGGPPYAIARVDTVKRKVETIISNKNKITVAAYVPSKDAVVYAAQDADSLQLCFWSKNGERKTIRRFPKETEVFGIAASPRAPEIAYVVIDGRPGINENALILENLDSGESRYLVNFISRREASMITLSWGPEANEITFPQLNLQHVGYQELKHPITKHINVIERFLGTHHLMVVRTDGASPPYEIFSEMTYHLGNDGGPLHNQNRDDAYKGIAWSPDGSYLAFGHTMESSWQNQIYVARRGETGYYQLTWGGVVHPIVWAPNGDRIMFTGIQREVFEIQSYEIKFWPEMLKEPAWTKMAAASQPEKQS